MTRPLKPPKGVFVPTSVVFHPKMKPGEKVTLMQLMALAWNNNEHITPPITYTLLSELTGKSVRTLHGHIAALRNNYAALLLQHTEDGITFVTLSDWLYKKEKTQPKQREHDPPDMGVCKNLQLPFKEEEDDSESINLRENLLLNRGVQKSAHHDKNAENCTPGVSGILPEELKETLVKAGVFPVLLCQVAQSGRSEEDLLALLRWCQEDQPECPGQLFMGRLRMDATAPKEYYQPPCPECGRYGEHAPDCSRRYLSGGLADYLEH